MTRDMFSEWQRDNGLVVTVTNGHGDEVVPDPNEPCPVGPRGDHLWTRKDTSCRYCGTDMESERGTGGDYHGTPDDPCPTCGFDKDES